MLIVASPLAPGGPLAVRGYKNPDPHPTRLYGVHHAGGALEGEGSLEERNFRSSQFQNATDGQQLFCDTQNVLKLAGARADSSKLRHLDGSLTQTPILTLQS